QGVMYLSALAGWMAQQLGTRSVLFGPSLMFLTLNITTALALWDALRSKYRVTWQRAYDRDEADEVISSECSIRGRFTTSRVAGAGLWLCEGSPGDHAKTGASPKAAP